MATNSTQRRRSNASKTNAGESNPTTTNAGESPNADESHPTTKARDDKKEEQKG